jgi:hypothetical protein
MGTPDSFHRLGKTDEMKMGLIRNKIKGLMNGWLLFPPVRESLLSVPWHYP